MKSDTVTVFAAVTFAVTTRFPTLNEKETAAKSPKTAPVTDTFVVVNPPAAILGGSKVADPSSQASCFSQAVPL